MISFDALPRTRFVVACTVAATLCLATGGASHLEARQSAHLPASVASDLERTVQLTLESVPVPGMAVAVIRDGEVALARGYGVADRAEGRPVTSETLFQVGSISKSFTATLGALLASRGAFSWDDPVAQHLPHATIPDPEMTLRQLATHTSGLPGDAPTLRRKHGDYPVLAFTHFELYRSLDVGELQFTPGSGWGYSNFGYAVLGHALENVTGEPFEVLLDDELLSPLAMGSTTATLWPEVADRLATPHWLVNDSLAVYPAHWDQEALTPAGGLSSTVADLGRYLAYQLAQGERNAAIGELQQAHVETGGAPYGMGWFVEELDGLGRVVSVGGDVDGFVGELVLAPEHAIGVALLANSGDVPPIPYLGRWLVARLLAETSPEAARQATYFSGMIDQSLGRADEAVRRFLPLTEGPEPDPRALYQLGRTAALTGRHLDAGRRALERYLSIPPAPGLSHAAAQWRLGLVQERAGRCDSAAASYRSALALDPGFGAAQAALEDLHCPDDDDDPRGGGREGRDR